ncbi:hypothetical protein T265_05853 [Opisthorchis viverrini]|uniref:Uncharacterized protein n=1 Tax=Opisthorchis viverrini TaxID=6198 RepID=A0A074ZMN3_OPIVI|nr:hypothetical protein T265_05853 [Opisthorchis viverrini]KER27022.1 hypothetical protein T265_05853 [Opisthorchis viverrini]
MSPIHNSGVDCLKLLFTLEKYTHLQINLVFTGDSIESLVYDVLQLDVLHTGRLMIHTKIPTPLAVQYSRELGGILLLYSEDKKATRRNCVLTQLQTYIYDSLVTVFDSRSTLLHAHIGSRAVVPLSRLIIDVSVCALVYGVPWPSNWVNVDRSINTSTLTQSISRYERKNHTATGLGAKKPNGNQRSNWVKGRKSRKTEGQSNERKRPNPSTSTTYRTAELNVPNEPTRHRRLKPREIHRRPIKLHDYRLQNYQILFRSYIITGRRGGIHPLNPELTMSPRLVMKRLQSNCQARRTDQQPN